MAGIAGATLAALAVMILIGRDVWFASSGALRAFSALRLAAAVPLALHVASAMRAQPPAWAQWAGLASAAATLLFAVLDGLRDAAFAVALVQAVGAILLIANMVQVAAYTRRTEIGIMRLVGASRWYTQLPFLVEAMLAAPPVAPPQPGQHVTVAWPVRRLLEPPPSSPPNLGE